MYGRYISAKCDYLNLKMIIDEESQIGGRRKRKGRKNKKKQKQKREESSASADIMPKRKVPNKINELLLSEDIWRFNKDIPKNLVELPEKIWFVKKTIRHKIHVKTPVGEKISPDNLPKGFSLWYPPPDADIAEAREEIKNLFDREVALGKNAKLPFASYPKRGLHYIFGTNVKVKPGYKYHEAIELLQKESPILANYCQKYYEYVSKIYNLEQDELADNAILVILRYEPKSGIWLHVDNVARYDRGPIMTTSLGPEKVIYDLTPTLLEDGKAMRVEFDEGDVAIMDGPARMDWAHGLPYGIDKYKYTIMFKCDHFKSRQVGYQDIIGTKIYQSIQYDENDIPS